jgi:hypothetical protein
MKMNETYLPCFALALHPQVTQAQKYIGKNLDSLMLRGVQRTIVISATGDSEVELLVMYVVTNARWSLLYDLRAAIMMDAKDSEAMEDA